MKEVEHHNILSIYIKYKSRQNSFMVLKVKIVIIFNLISN